jgi:syntaxin 5
MASAALKASNIHSQSLWLTLHLVAKRKTLFDDKPVEISELTFVIKQELATMNQQISALQQLSRSQHPQRSGDQEGEHNKNVRPYQIPRKSECKTIIRSIAIIPQVLMSSWFQVVLLLQGKLTDVSANFKDVLEIRTKNIQASRSRTENFVSSVSGTSGPLPRSSDSPLYNTPTRRSPQPPDLLTLEPSNTPTLPQDQQMLMMEEGNNAYIQQRGQAIETIEQTINELGGIFGQLAAMVSEQGNMIERIDANTEDVVDNVQGAQRELMKYWSRVSYRTSIQSGHSAMPIHAYSNPIC